MSSQSLRTNILSVRAFGAVGNGVVDDTGAFNAAIAMGIAKRKPIFVPAGEYHVAPLDLILPHGNSAAGTFTLYGEGSHASILKLKGGSEAPILKLSPSDPSNALWGISIRELCFNGNAEADEYTNENHSEYNDPTLIEAFPLLRIENVGYSQFNKLKFTNALFGGMEDVAHENQDGGTTSRHNQYDSVLFHFVSNLTQNQDNYALLLQNTKFHLLTNIMIEDWGAGIHIEDTLTDPENGYEGNDPESGGFTNLQGISVVSCPGDGIRLTATNWVNVNGLNCMWIGRNSSDPPIYGEGYPVHTVGPTFLVDEGQGNTASLSQIVFTNLIFRSNKNDCICIEGPRTTSKIIISNAYMIGDKTKCGIKAEGLGRAIFSNISFNNLSNGLQLGKVPGSNPILNTAEVSLNGLQFSSCETALEFNDGTTRIPGSDLVMTNCTNGVVVNDTASEIWLDKMLFRSTTNNTISTAAGTSKCRFGSWNLDMDSGDIDLQGTDNSMIYDGNRMNVSTEYRVDDKRVVTDQQPEITGADTDAKVANIILALQAHGLVE